MKLLILGESDSKGYGLADRDLSWGNLLPRLLQERHGLDCEATHLAYYAHTPTALLYLRRVLEQGPFDAVVFSVTTIGFSLLSVDHRIARIFGKRAGDFFKSGVDNFDKTTRRGPRSGLVRRVNRAAHRVARNTIGQEPMAPYGVVLANHLEILAELARLEDTDVIVLGPTDHGGSLAKRVRKTQSAVETFRAAVRAEAERRRLTWVDRQALSLEARDRDAEFTDGLHKGPAFHARIADATIAAMAAVRDRQPAMAAR